MSEPRKPGVTLDHLTKRRAGGDRVASRRSPGERFAHFSDRLSRSLPGAVRAEHGDEDIDEETAVHRLTFDDDELAAPDEVFEEEPEDEVSPWYEDVPRFPIVRNGYDCPAVDRHVGKLEHDLAALEREVASLRVRARSEEEVRAEIKRIGEQTSAILVEAHDRAHETTSEAQETAQRLVSDARRHAQEIADEAERERSRLRSELDELVAQRDSVVADLDALAGRVAAVAREASGRGAAVDG